MPLAYNDGLEVFKLFSLPVLCAALIASAQAQDTYESTVWRADADELRYYWVPELSLTTGLAATWLTLYSITPRDVEGAADPKGLDAVRKPRWNHGAQDVSDLLGVPIANSGFNLPVASTIGIGVWGGLRDERFASGLIHSLVVLEAYASTIVVTEALKLGIARARPYTTAAFAFAHPDIAADPAFQGEFTEEVHWDAYKSMPSGHTSGTGAYSFAIATLVWRDAALHDRGTPAVAFATFGTAGALTATVGTLRVVGGHHHVSDTIVGGLLGAGIGMGVAWVHTANRTSESATGEGAPPMLTIGGVW